VSRKNDLEKQINEHTRRLQKFKEQQARKGIDTEPHILIEIEDIEAAVEKLQAELAELKRTPVQIKKPAQRKRIRQNQLKSTVSDILENVLSVIRARAAEDFPTDFSTQKYRIDQEIQAWQKIKSFKAEDLPPATLQIIMDRAAQDFGQDFSTQLYRIKTEVEAWRRLQQFEAPDVPSNVLHTIINNAVKDFPEDFGTCLYRINREVEAWRNLHQ
jgi:hypothetical protein